jgi:hypothetical protein
LLSRLKEEIAMKPVKSIIVLGALAVGAAACSYQERTYYPRSQAYAPAATTYYSTPGSTAVVATTPTYYNYDPPNFQKSNVYSSRWDYYRNYKGIHGGPERTGW